MGNKNSTLVLGWILGNLIFCGFSAFAIELPSLRLRAEQSVVAEGSVLKFQNDGNLVIYREGKPMWSSGTYGRNCAKCRAVFTKQGELRLLDGANQIYWTTNTGFNADAVLALASTEPFLKISKSGRTLWASSGMFPKNMIDLTKLNLPQNGVTNAPLIIQGQSNVVYSSLRISNPNGPCVVIRGSDNITITNSEIGPCGGSGIFAEKSWNLTIKENYIHNTGGQANVEIQQSHDCSIRDNQMSYGPSGVYVQQSASMSIRDNRFLNMQGPFPRGQFVQLNEVTGPYTEILCNLGENQMGQSRPEDAINVFKSSGTSEHYLHVYGNKIKGGGPSTSGGGILLGDGGESSFINALNNIVVNPGQYGIAVAGGSTINVYQNNVFAQAAPFTNVGMYAWNQYPSECSNISIFSNNVNWMNKENKPNPFWAEGNCGPIGGVTANNWAAPMTEDIINLPIPSCK